MENNDFTCKNTDNEWTDFSNSLEEIQECPICLETFNLASNNLIKTCCNHFYCKPCYDKIIECGLCRTYFNKKNNQTTNNNNLNNNNLNNLNQIQNNIRINLNNEREIELTEPNIINTITNINNSYNIINRNNIITRNNRNNIINRINRINTINTINNIQMNRFLSRDGEYFNFNYVRPNNIYSNIYSNIYITNSIL